MPHIASALVATTVTTALALPLTAPAVPTAPGAPHSSSAPKPAAHAPPSPSAPAAARPGARPAPTRPTGPTGPAAVADRPYGPCALTGIRDHVSEVGRTPPGYARSSGTVRAITLFIDFPDAPAAGPVAERYGEFFPMAADYFRAASYGRLDYRATAHARWIRMSRPFAAYGIGRGTPFDPASGSGYYAISKEILAAVDRDIDFSRYDLINVLATPNAGPPATESVLSVTFSGGPIGLDTDDGVPFTNASFIWSRQTGDSAFRVLDHEVAHAFGLPDLYYTDGKRRPPPVGHWDPMDEDWGPADDFLAWHKWKLGWLRAGQAHCVTRPGTSTYTLTPTAAAGGLKLVAVPLSGSRAITVEARDQGPLDPTVCRPGVLVASVDAAAATGTGPVHVADATPGSGGCATDDPNVDAELSDAAYRAGQTFAAEGVRVEVLGQDGAGRWRVRVTSER
ncbi:M6 family metalloprotease domain-containing protein [Streptomyces sp. NPDC057654]|uniref:M6 family metalloprotease domain-containing protein n=1 Tax=Streptomyces sp. NPDC057654 TaxID=3346196 RepID=UPI0036A75F0C